MGKVVPLTECRDLVFLRPSPTTGADEDDKYFFLGNGLIYSDELCSRYSTKLEKKIRSCHVSLSHWYWRGHCQKSSKNKKNGSRNRVEKIILVICIK